MPVMLHVEYMTSNQVTAFLNFFCIKFTVISVGIIWKISLYQLNKKSFKTFCQTPKLLK